MCGWFLDYGQIADATLQAGGGTCRLQEQQDLRLPAARGGSTRCPRGDSPHTHTPVSRLSRRTTRDPAQSGRRSGRAAGGHPSARGRGRSASPAPPRPTCRPPRPRRTSCGLPTSLRCRTFAGWVHAAFVIDVHSRRVVGWQLSGNVRPSMRSRWACGPGSTPANRSTGSSTTRTGALSMSPSGTPGACRMPAWPLRLKRDSCWFAPADPARLVPDPPPAEGEARANVRGPP